MSPSTLDPDRLGILARRIGWLDRWRRPIAVMVALYVCVQMFRSLDGVFGPTHLISGGFSLFSGAAVWWVVEAALAAVAAFWENEHDALADTRGLPRAFARSPRRRGWRGWLRRRPSQHR